MKTLLGWAQHDSYSYAEFVIQNSKKNIFRLNNSFKSIISLTHYTVDETLDDTGLPFE